ncbi:hypothetical protein H0H93_004948 [Arthromyces matolae]|nr:hypothetical protein H0H93_004948 [Arthromyces matolae]
MPAVLTCSQARVTVYHSAESLPQNVWDAFKLDQRRSNIMYPHALEHKLQSDPRSDDQLWLVCTTGNAVDFILSCTQHAMGAYPIFIYSTIPAPNLLLPFVVSRVQLLVNSLGGTVDVGRVYSVFAFDIVARAFAEVWSNMMDIGVYVEPYYAAKLTYCTRRSLKPRQFTMMPGVTYELRPALSSDIPAAARLCHGFAEAAQPFALTMDEAVKEATHLISQNQLWVHSIKTGNAPTELASIVAVTRESASVSAITKVFTNPVWRSRGQKESVVLYVAHNNPAASKVYNRVGFVGLDENMPQVEGVDSWLELGFDREKTELGHW